VRCARCARATQSRRAVHCWCIPKSAFRDYFCTAPPADPPSLSPSLLHCRWFSKAADEVEEAARAADRAAKRDGCRCLRALAKTKGRARLLRGWRVWDAAVAEAREATQAAALVAFAASALRRGHGLARAAACGQERPRVRAACRALARWRAAVAAGRAGEARAAQAARDAARDAEAAEQATG